MRSLLHTRYDNQHGGTIVTFALLLLLLLGVAGIALDFGRMFIVKTELQTAMDSCALSAAQELDSLAGARARARSAGITAASLNKANLQSSAVSVSDADIVFYDSSSTGIAGSDGAAEYVECLHTADDISTWLVHILGFLSNDAQAASSVRTVAARAVARRAPAQSTCPVPVGLIAKPGTLTPPYGYSVGEWAIAFSKSNDNDNADDQLVPGEMGWFNLDGTQSASVADLQLSEQAHCDTVVDTSVSVLTPGAKSSLQHQWNARFGIHENPQVTLENARPDISGYSYRPANWPSRSNAFPDFLTRRATYTPFQGGNGNKPKAADIATAAELQQYGYNRRVVIVPVLIFEGDRVYKITDFACMFLLGPIRIFKNEDVYMEYLGRASDKSSPCSSGGIPGGSAGPRVPALVR